jgi:HPt (histidine-containing phosphotransfer) domain-containing protein
MSSSTRIDNNLNQESVLSGRTSAAEASGDAVDMAVLNSFEEAQGEGEPDLIVELIDLYLEDTPHRVADIREALAKTDGLSLQRSAHGLKGSSASLGAGQVAKLCEELELKANEVSFQEVALIVTRLEREFERVREIFVTERQRRCG